jgi:hypothetical protein
VNGYVIGGYIVVLASLSTYAIALVIRLRVTRRRLGVVPPVTEARSDHDGDGK